MGAITRIRQISPYFLGVFAVLFIVFMVLQDSSCTSFRTNQKTPDKIVVGEVNGEKIYQNVYETRVKEAIDQQKGQNPDAEIDDEQIRSQIFDQMVDEILRKQEADRLGLTVTKQEILDVMLYNPPDFLTQGFKDSLGRFNRQAYLDLVTNPDALAERYTAAGRPEEEGRQAVETLKRQLLQIEDYMRVSKLEEALRTAVGATASITTPAFAEAQYRSDNTFAAVKYAFLDADRVPDAGFKVSEDEIRAYYDKNKEYLEQKPARKIKYMTFPLVASTKDTQAAQKRSADLQRLLASAPTAAARDSIFTIEMSSKSGTTVPFKTMNEVDPMATTVLASLAQGDVFGPLNTVEGMKYYRLDGRREGTNPVTKASHILIPFGANKDSAKIQATSVMARAKKGEDFGALAREFSKDPGSAAQGGDLGYFGKGRMVKEFEDAALGAAVGSVVGPVETQYGYHIIKVTDKQTTELSWSEITIKPTLSGATKQRILADAAMAVKDMEDGKSIDDIAKNLKRQVTETQFFEERTPILGSRELTRWAFDNEKGAAHKTEIKNMGWVVAQITDTRSAGIKPMEDVKDMIIAKLKGRKKVESLKSAAESLAQQLKSAGSVDAASTLNPMAIVSEMPQVRDNGALQAVNGEYDIANAMIKAPVGQVIGPIKGNRGWFIFISSSNAKADMAQFAKDKQAIMQNSAARSRQTTYYSWIAKVRENATIVDNRGKQQD